ASSSQSPPPASFSFAGTASPDLYTLSLHDALPISGFPPACIAAVCAAGAQGLVWAGTGHGTASQAVESALADATAAGVVIVRARSEEHTSELQSRENLVCRLLLEKKKAEHANATDT